MTIPRLSCLACALEANEAEGRGDFKLAMRWYGTASARADTKAQHEIYLAEAKRCGERVRIRFDLRSRAHYAADEEALG